MQPNDKFVVRLPDGLRREIKAAAEANNRSMNSEIVERSAGGIETIRDKFAGQALSGIYASQWFYDHAKEFNEIKGTGDHANGAARAAYVAADAMIAARKGGAS